MPTSCSSRLTASPSSPRPPAGVVLAARGIRRAVGPGVAAVQPTALVVPGHRSHGAVPLAVVVDHYGGRVDRDRLGGARALRGDRGRLADVGALPQERDLDP